MRAATYLELATAETNLIALHPDDHATIHRLRGDKFVVSAALLSIKDRVVSEETKEKISKNRKGKQSPKLICRISDRKELDAQNWAKYTKTNKRSIPKLKKVCRISDRKEMTLQSWMMYVNGHTEKAKKKVSIANKGNQHTKGMKFGPQSIETRIKKSKAHKGKPKPKVVCRVSDRKEMSAANWAMVEKRLPKEPFSARSSY